MAAAIMPASPMKFISPFALPNGHQLGNQEGNPESLPWQYDHGAVATAVQPVHESSLEEPSPLGLTLRKSQSLLELISSRLSQDGSQSQALEPVEEAMECSEVVAPEHNLWYWGGHRLRQPVAFSIGPVGVTDAMPIAVRNSSDGNAPADGTPPVIPVNYYAHGQDKMKASNFACSTMKIGSWEKKSRYEGDLVAKCYYAKRKLVWEVLENGLKSKLEIQWGDISFMKASCPEKLPGTLEIEVSRPPLFFEETSPQPRKHTVWQAASDFTGGQASTCRRHVLTFPEGGLNKPYEKLLQCDPRLRSLVEGTTSVCHPPHVHTRQIPSPPPAMPYDPSLTPSPPPYEHHAQDQSHRHYQHLSNQGHMPSAYDAHLHYAPHEPPAYHLYPAVLAGSMPHSHYGNGPHPHVPRLPVYSQMAYDRHHHTYELHGISDAGSGTASTAGSDDDAELLQEEMPRGGPFDPMDIIHSVPHGGGGQKYRHPHSAAVSHHSTAPNHGHAAACHPQIHPIAHLSSQPLHHHPRSNISYSNALTPSLPSVAIASALDPHRRYPTMHVGNPVPQECRPLENFRSMLNEEVLLEYDTGYMPGRPEAAFSMNGGGMPPPGLTAAQQSDMSLQGIATMPDGNTPGHHHLPGHHPSSHPAGESSGYPAAMALPHRSGGMGTIPLLTGERGPEYLPRYPIQAGGSKTGSFPSGPLTRGRGRPRIDAAPSMTISKSFAHSAAKYSHSPQPYAANGHSPAGSAITEQPHQNHFSEMPHAVLYPSPSPAVSESFSAARVDVKWEGGAVVQRSPGAKRTWVRTAPLAPALDLIPQNTPHPSEFCLEPSELVCQHSTMGKAEAIAPSPSWPSSGQSGGLILDASVGDLLMNLPRVASLPQFV